MTRSRTVSAPPRPTYFFLSYAHSAPISEDSRQDTDAWVREFFDHLYNAVRRHARPVPGMEIGFFDQQVPLGSDWKAVLAEWLGAAEVFVPLYSPGYFSRSWSLRERESFVERLAASDSAQPRAHIVPVLWTPFPPWDDRPEVREALRLGEDIAEYAENGMRALCMLASYRKHYTRLLDRLAERIVRVAERSPLGPSTAPVLDEVVPERVGEGEGGQTAFVVAVAAPGSAGLSPQRNAASYGPDGTQWRPFAARQALPVAEYAAATAERLGVRVRVTTFRESSEMFAHSPAVLLIDPWLAAGNAGLNGLRAATKDLPEWVVPVVVVDRQDPQYAERGAHLADDVMTMLKTAGLARAKRVNRMKEFVEIMPRLVTEARRQYLRHGPVYPPAGGPSTLEGDADD
jgi:FxsC-like protein